MTLKAADTYKLLEPLPCIQGVGDCNVGTMQRDISLDDYIGYIFKFAIALAAFLAVIMIIWGGFEYMTSEIPSLKLEGKGRISNAIIGLLMVLASYLILATIDPRLVAINTKIPVIRICNEADLKLDAKSRDCIDTSSVAKFRSNLNKDLDELTKLTQETQQEVNLLVADRETKEKRIEELNLKNSSEAGLTEAELKELEALKQGITINTNAIYSTVAKEVGIISYQRVTEIMLKMDTTDEDIRNLRQYYDPKAEKIPNIPNAKDGGKLPTNTPNALQNHYNDNINKILKTDPEKAQMLANQRDFYIKLIEDQYELSDKAKSHKQQVLVQGSMSGPSTYANNTKYLKEHLAIETNNLNDVRHMNVVTSKTGITEKDYRIIIETKIKIINGALSR